MIGKILRYMRIESGTIQETLAKAVGKKQTTLSGYETGVSMPNYDTVEQIAKVCGYEIVFVDRYNKNPITEEDLNKPYKKRIV